MGRFCPGDSFSRGLPAFLLLLKFFENKKAKYMAFAGLEDFNLFEEVHLSDIRSDKYRMKNKQNDRQR